MSTKITGVRPRQLGEDAIGGLERAVDRVHEHAADQIHHRDLDAVGRPEAAPADARRAGRKIRRTQQTRFALEVIEDLPLAPDVIAGGEHVDAGVEQLAATVRIDPGATRNVLAVGDHEARLGAMDELRQQPAHGEPPGFADDVAEEEDVHREGQAVSG